MNEDELNKENNEYQRESALGLAMRFVNAHNNVNKDKWDINVVLHAAEIFYKYMQGKVNVPLGVVEVPPASEVEKSVDISKRHSVRKKNKGL